MNMNGFKHIEPSDVATESAYLDMLYSNISLCGKPYMGSTDTRFAAKDSIEIAGIVFGGKEKLKKMPVMIGLINPLSPLQYADEMAGSIIEYARFRQPVIIVNMIMAGTSGPVKLPGLFALMNAEILAGLVLSQLVGPGTPVIYGTTSCPTNMKKGALSLSASVRNGANFILHSCGMMGTYISNCFEKWIIDEEMCGMIQQMFKPVDINDEQINVEAIETIGIGGNFLLDSTTLKCCRTAFYHADLYNKTDHVKWKESGSKRIDDLAAEKLIERLNTYEKPDMNPDIETSLKQFIWQRKKELQAG